MRVFAVGCLMEYQSFRELGADVPVPLTGLKKTPSSCNAFRTATASGSLIASTAIVTRPICVRAFNSGPSQAKCSAQPSRRGWKRRTTYRRDGFRVGRGMCCKALPLYPPFHSYRPAHCSRAQLVRPPPLDVDSASQFSHHGAPSFSSLLPVSCASQDPGAVVVACTVED